ncbi:MAG: type 1 periplasmic-binding domain-containing protein [Mycobacteriales bacterium]
MTTLVPRLVAASALLAATPCGKTVLLSNAGGVGGGTGLGAGAASGPSSIGPATAATASAGTLLGTANALVQGAGPQPGQTSAPSASAGTGSLSTSTSRQLTPAGGIPQKGWGWDAKNVYVAIITASDASTGLQALGISLDPGDEFGDAKAVVAELNCQGGLFGRTIVLIDKDDKSASVLANPAAAGQADCTHFAQDDPVITVVNTDAALDLDNFRACFKNARIPLVTVTTSAFDHQTASSLSPYFYNALSVSWSRLIPPVVRWLHEQGYFGGWNATTGTSSPAAKTKIGVLYGGDSAGARDGPALIAALKQAGYATDSFQYGSDGDAKSAELKFAGGGVTHVIGIDNFQFFLMTAARSQHYLPRYGVTTYNGPQALLASNGDAAQLNGALGIGWYPTIDTEQAQDPGPSPGTNPCLAALKAGGQTFSGKRFAQAVGMAICDGIRLGVLGAKAGGGLNPAAIRQGILAIGTSLPTGGSFASGLSATNYAMPSAGRDIGWDNGCQCFTYRGPTYRIG